MRRRKLTYGLEGGGDAAKGVRVKDSAFCHKIFVEKGLALSSLVAWHHEILVRLLFISCVNLSLSKSRSIRHVPLNQSLALDMSLRGFSMRKQLSALSL